MYIIWTFVYLQKLNPKLYVTGSLFHHLIFKILFSHLFQTTEERKNTRPLTVSFFQEKGQEDWDDFHSNVSAREKATGTPADRGHCVLPAKYWPQGKGQRIKVISCRGQNESKSQEYHFEFLWYTVKHGYGKHAYNKLTLTAKWSLFPETLLHDVNL